MDALAQDVAVLSIAAAADQASTAYALKRCSSCYEGNPLMGHPPTALLLKSASVAVTSYGCDRLRKRGHKGWAKVLRWTVAGVWLGVAANNMRLAQNR